MRVDASYRLAVRSRGKESTLKTLRKMKKRNKFYLLAGGCLLAAMMVVASCSTKEDDTAPYPAEELNSSTTAYSASAKGGMTPAGGEGSGESSHGGNTEAGIVTAAEWCDLTHWSFWSGLMLSEDFSNMGDYWKFYTNNRVAVKVTDAKGNAMAGVSVKLLSEGNGTGTVWETVTDNHGLAECWLGMFQPAKADANRLRVSVNGTVMNGHPVVCPLDSLMLSVPVNEYVCNRPSTVTLTADIAFIVDATGSMMDEINFLKSDLMDIIGHVESVRPAMKMRTAALFYRDEGDEYLTRHHNFSDDVASTLSFVEQQQADGGGDYPEAVHTALEKMLQELSWDKQARTRLAFLVLDAPAHYEEAVIRSLQQSVEQCARQGIKLIPVAASGVDKNTEFMLRFFANATGGTYVFLTDDSGVGESHLKASVGDYQVEQLNKLLIRLIEYYTE